MWHFETMAPDQFQILQQLPARDGFQLRYSVAVDSNWHPLPPPLAAAGRQSFAANKQQEWLHGWTPRGLLTEQNIVSPAGEEGFKICTRRWLIGPNRISSRTEILDAQGEIAAWLGGTWKRKSEHTSDIALAAVGPVSLVVELQQCVARLEPGVGFLVVQVIGEASVDTEISDFAIELAITRDICVLVVGTKSGGVMADGCDVLGVVGSEPVVFDSTCGRVGCGLVDQQDALQEWAPDVQVALGPRELQIKCSNGAELVRNLETPISVSDPMLFMLVR